MHHHEAQNNPQYSYRFARRYHEIVNFCLLRPELCNRMSLREEFNDLQPAHLEKLMLQLVHDGFASSEAALSAAPLPPQQLQLTAPSSTAVPTPTSSPQKQPLPTKNTGRVAVPFSQESMSKSKRERYSTIAEPIFQSKRQRVTN